MEALVDAGLGWESDGDLVGVPNFHLVLLVYNRLMRDLLNLLCPRLNVFLRGGSIKRCLFVRLDLGWEQRLACTLGELLRAGSLVLPFGFLTYDLGLLGDGIECNLWRTVIKPRRLLLLCVGWFIRV